jgi:3-hydroxyisobutyrate dehydrogenase
MIRRYAAGWPGERETTTMTTRIGFVGLGAMGMPMARHLRSAGFPVTAFDIRPATVAAFAGEGGKGAGTAAEALAGAEAAILMVVNADQARQVLLAEKALAGMAPDGIVILMATCAPRAVEEIAAAVAATGRRFVDAPVSGGVAGATAGTLTVMAAADEATFAAAKPVLSAMGDKVFHVGEKPGQGATAKTINQLLCGVHIAVAAEALSLAEKIGFDPRVALDIVGGSAASSWMLRDRGPRMLQAEPEVKSAIDIFVKDLGIVLEAGHDAGTALPIAAVAHQLFLAMSGRGEGKSDDSQVIRAYRSLQGRKG